MFELKIQELKKYSFRKRGFYRFNKKIVFCLIKIEGTWMSASAHIITAVVGSGVLSLTWCLAQLGWIFGSFLLVVFAVISWYTCTLLTNCYRSPHPVTGARNYNYMQAVKNNLGKIIPFFL
ncbi:putative amino acid transporter, transmembrane domain-containing protein [Helianthus annuus]|nr:putative amino acid transporter, transmembrane domain-containing protein [Helianthus annuus]